MTPNLSRRKFLAGASAASLLATSDLHAQQAVPTTPDAALQRLMDGNKRFAADQLLSFAEDLKILKADTVDKQEPFAAVLSCADARVPVELVFDQTIGHIFVCRVAGNITTPEIIASLEYGAAVLGTKVIMVLAHGQCGAVKATIGGGAVPGQISVLYSAIRPAVDEAGPDLDATSKANALNHAKLLREASPVIAGQLAENKIKVVAGFYDVGTGKVTLL